MLQKLSKYEVKVHNTRIYLQLNFAWNQFWQSLNIKNAIFTISESVKFEFWYIWDLRNGSNLLKLKFRASKSAKNDIFDGLNSPKFDFM